MNSQAVTLPPQAEDEINLRDYWRVLVKRRVFIVCLTLGVAFGTAFITLLQLNVYQSKATLIPFAESKMNSQQVLLGNLLGFTGGVSQSPADRLLAILKSRTLAEEVIKRLDLMPLLFTESWDANRQQWLLAEPPTLEGAVGMLRSMVDITADKMNTVISITVLHADPVLGAAIATQYVEELQKILREKAFSLAKKNRLFIEEQFKKTQEELQRTEEALRSFEQEYKIVALDEQTRAAVEAITSAESQVMAKEVQLHVLRQAMTGASQEVHLLQEELLALRTQLARLKHKSDTSITNVEKIFQSNTELFPSLEQAPEIKLQYVRLQRDAMLQNKLFTFFAEHIEQARLEEARDETKFQILDRAIPTHSKAKPRRAISIFVAIIFGSFVSIVLVLCSEYFATTISTKEQLIRHVPLPLMATIPLYRQHKTYFRHMRLRTEPRYVLREISEPSLRQALRYLHMRLKSLNGSGPLQAIVFTSASADEDCATLVASLALVTASMGERTLLIDGNIHAPSLHSYFHSPLSPGFVDVLIHDEEWQKSIQLIANDKLSFIPSGVVTQEIFSFIKPQIFYTLLEELRKCYDTIFYISSPVIMYSDIVLVNKTFDATCLVITSSISHTAAVNEAISILESVKSNVIGTVFISS